jgi:Domain of unknown function (DUF4189)
MRRCSRRCSSHRAVWTRAHHASHRLLTRSGHSKSSHALSSEAREGIMKQHYVIFAVLFSCVSAWSNQSGAAGAVAIALPPEGAQLGVSYGVANDLPDDPAAQAAAMNLCRTSPDARTNEKLRSLCKVVQSFSNQCAADAMDPQNVTPGFGWAVANDKHTTEVQALANCQTTAGPGRAAACKLHSFKCDGSAAN